MPSLICGLKCHGTAMLVTCLLLQSLSQILFLAQPLLSGSCLKPQLCAHRRIRMFQKVFTTQTLVASKYNQSLCGMLQAFSAAIFATASTEAPPRAVPRSTASAASRIHLICKEVLELLGGTFSETCQWH